MEDFKLSRNVIRLNITKSLTNLKDQLQSNSLCKDGAKLYLKILQEKMNQLEDLNKMIFHEMVKCKLSEDEIALEIDDVDEYKMKFSRVKLEVIKTFPEPTVNKEYERERRYLLPKIEIKKFTGNAREWLYFWSQFKKIHEDESIDKEEKFQYLIQATEKDTKAREMVDKYPSTAENYDKVISDLTTRFGKEDLLVEVYVREMLELVLRNATTSDKKIPFSKIYSKVESQLHALESLGVTTEKCAIILYTLVESLLPEVMLRSWQKYNSTFNVNSTENQLTRLMEFLKINIEHEERVSLVKRDLFESVEELINKGKSKKRKRKLPKDNEMTSTGIISCLLFSITKLFRILVKKI